MNGEDRCLPPAAGAWVMMMMATLLSLGLLAQPVAASTGGHCNASLDCALNGDCENGRCVCRPPWTGDAQCHTLRFLPTRPLAAYPPDRRMSVQGNATSSWGGSIVAHGGIYHMFAAEMANGCKLNSFLTNSECVHATSASPVGPFEKQSTAVGAYCHNPAITLRQFPNGTALWVLFHVADVGTDRGPPKQCAQPSSSAPSTLSAGTALGSGAENVDTSPQHFAWSPDGPWSPIALDAPMADCNNPAPFVHKNGTYYVVCRPDYQLWRTDDVLSGAWTLVSNITDQNGSNWRSWGLPGQLPGHYEDPGA
jgi:hypothetical protein